MTSTTLELTEILRAVRHKLGLGSESMDLFLTSVEELVSTTDSSGIDKPILGIAQVLNAHPYELYKLNPLFHPARLEFDVRHSHVPYVVLQKPGISYIYTLTFFHGLRHGFETLSSLRLRDILMLQFPSPEYDYLHDPELPPIFMGCLAQLVQDLLDNSHTSKHEREVLLKFLRRSGGQVPPSYTLYDVKNQTRFRETALSDLKKGFRNNRAVVIKYPRGLRDNFTNKEIVREIILIHQLRHPNIVSLLGVNFLKRWQDSEDVSVGLVTTYMQHGNVMEFLKTHPTINRMTVVWQVANGLEYLHKGFDFPVAHRDLKGENILVDDKLVCRLTDFGLSSIPELSRQSRLDKVVGTFVYIAPEMGERTGVDLLKADIFSLGNTFIEIFTGNPVLFIHLPQVLKRLKQGELSMTSPPEFFWKIVGQMMSIDANKRPFIKVVRQAIEEFDPPKTIIITEYTARASTSILEEPEILPDFTTIRDIACGWIIKQRKNQAAKRHQTAKSSPWPLPANPLSAAYRSIFADNEKKTSSSKKPIQQHPNHLHIRSRDLRRTIHRKSSPAQSDLGIRNGLATPVTPTMRTAVPPSPALSALQLPEEDQQLCCTPPPKYELSGRPLYQPRPVIPRAFLISVAADCNNGRPSSGSESNDSLNSPVPKSPLSPRPLSPLSFKRDIRLSLSESSDFNGQENVAPTIDGDGGSTSYKRRRTTQEPSNSSYSSSSSSRGPSQLNFPRSSH